MSEVIPAEVIGGIRTPGTETGNNWAQHLKDVATDVKATYLGLDDAAATYAPLSVPLDIWPAFLFAGGGTEDFAVSNYAAWIAGIDGLLAGSGATKTDEGAASDSLHVYSYKIGTGPRKVLLIGGMHPGEMLGQAVALRFAQKMATSPHPAMRSLRASTTLIWIPTLTPSGFGTARKNANDVDINRNSPFYWGPYTPENSTFAKGSTAGSEPETQILKAIIDREKITCLIDAHNTPDSGPSVQFAAPSQWVLGPRDLIYGSMSAWDEIYNADTGLTFADIARDNPHHPTVISWFNWYARHVRNPKTEHAAGILFEARHDLLGSVFGVSVSQAAMRAYCGMILTFIESWIQEGRRPPRPYVARWRGQRTAITTSDEETALEDGGSRINSTTQQLVHWQAIAPFRVSSTGPIIYCPFPGPGVAFVRLAGYVRNLTSNEQRVDFYIGASGDYNVDWVHSIIVPPNGRAAINGFRPIGVSSIGATSIPEITCTAGLVGGSNVCVIPRLVMTVELQPFSDVFPSVPAN